MGDIKRQRDVARNTEFWIYLTKFRTKTPEGPTDFTPPAVLTFLPFPGPYARAKVTGQVTAISTYGTAWRTTATACSSGRDSTTTTLSVRHPELGNLANEGKPK